MFWAFLILSYAVGGIVSVSLMVVGVPAYAVICGILAGSGMMYFTPRQLRW